MVICEFWLVNHYLIMNLIGPSFHHPSNISYDIMINRSHRIWRNDWSNINDIVHICGRTHLPDNPHRCICTSYRTIRYQVDDTIQCCYWVYILLTTSTTFHLNWLIDVNDCPFLVCNVVLSCYGLWWNICFIGHWKVKGDNDHSVLWS